MQILVYRDEQPQEDGSVLKPWVATHVRKAVSAEGATLDGALANLVTWLLASEDPSDERVPRLDHVDADGAPHHRNAATSVAEKFANAAAYVGAVVVPEGWEVRVA